MVPGSVNFGISRGLDKGTVAAVLINALMEDSIRLDTHRRYLFLFF